MDRNQIIGFVLMAVLLVGYMFIFEQPEETENEPANTEITTPDPNTTAAETTVSPQEPTTTDTANYSQQYGVFAAGMTGEASDIIIENDQAIFTFTSMGGLLKAVELKEFTTWQKEPLILLNEQTSSQALTLQTTNGNINIADLYFKPSRTGRTISGTDSTTFTFTLPLDGNSIVHTYKIGGTGYEVKHNIKVNGLQNNIIGSELKFVWSNDMRRQEMNLEDERNKSTIMYHTLADDTDELKEISTSPESELLAEQLKWVSFNQKFFNAGVIAEKSFAGGEVSYGVPLTDTTIVKNAVMSLAIPMGDIYAGANLKYYLGPNNFKGLKKVAPDYEENVYMGYKLVSWVNKLIIVNLFYALESVIGNYGVIIIILVLIIKLCLFPLSRKSYLSMAKMKALKPELDAMKEKLGGDQQKMQQEQMKLYREVGVNPISGCLPVVLQMPFLFAMFFFFPNSIELRGESFLWATDLSTYDVLFYLPFEIPFYGRHVSGFTLLMTISTILYTWSNNQVSTVQGPMKTIGYVMPLIFMFVLNSYSSGLSFYYFVSNIVTFGQQTIIRRYVDEDKIRATLEENKKKNANKGQSKWRQKLDEAMKASQEAQKQKQKKKK
jgi:YidC/Oxa1 family membrane protein insertase